MPAGDPILVRLGLRKKEEEKKPVPAPDPTAGMTTQQKIQYHSPEARKARAATASAKAAEEEKKKQIQSLNPVDPSGGAFQRFLNRAK